MESKNTSKELNGIKLTFFIDSEQSMNESLDILKGVIKFFDYKVEAGCEISCKTNSNQEEFAKSIKESIRKEIENEQRSGGLLWKTQNQKLKI